MKIPTDNQGNRAILSLNATKAFDSVEWHYLWQVLEIFNLGQTFIPWIKLLNKALKACIRINNTLSPSFALHRGTRQGCPLSPLLFSLAIETLAAAIRANPNIRGFERGDMEEKLALYADGALLFLGHTTNSITSLMTLVQRFGTFSGFKINIFTHEVHATTNRPSCFNLTPNDRTDQGNGYIFVSGYSYPSKS